MCYVEEAHFRFKDTNRQKIKACDRYICEQHQHEDWRDYTNIRQNWLEYKRYQ